MSISTSSICGPSWDSAADTEQDSKLVQQGWGRELTDRVNQAPEDLDDYLAVYVQSHSDPSEDIKANIKPNLFDKWTPAKGKEAVMYNHLIDAFEALVKHFPKDRRLTFCDCAGQKISFPFKDHADHHETKPDLVVSFPGKALPRKQTNPTWWAVSMVMEAKATEEQDPFGKQGQVHVDTVTQLAISARNLFFAHDFCCVFVVGLYGHSARIVRFDRSSAIVSKRFDYRKRPDILQRFFWRLVHPIDGDTIAGCDRAVHPLTAPDVQWVKNQLKKLQWGIAISESSDEALLEGRKVTVPESDARDAVMRTFILFDLIDVNARLLSKATMVWMAMEDTRERPLDQTGEDSSSKLVVFKETWRCSGADLGKRKMEAWTAAGGKFPHEVDINQDPVKEPSFSDGSMIHTTNADGTQPVLPPDVTSTPNASASPEHPPEVVASAGQHTTPASAASSPLPYPLYQTHGWRLLFGDKHFTREHSLVRFVVNAVGRPLKRFRSTRELVEAVRDAIEGHREAWDVGVLHRDVSTGNVLIAERPEERLRGFLHDFDYSSMTKDIPPPLDSSDTLTDPRLRMAEAGDDDDLKERTGTYHCMSYYSLENEDAIHSVQHDLESFYWTLLWIVLRHTIHDLKVTEDEPDPCNAVFRFGNDQDAGRIKRAWLTTMNSSSPWNAIGR
ncbi:hypothetical protein BD311DRAFT_865880 [Dichomitus squalens]|uniref:Fungal-type protein kinase domain-containing protein n=1 Tax=Dichomitus squalens TaxID=114155 RepID=A0A4Q9MJV4_9APHY|nr:hypothetical protein BD311DRAFT_865880 [Dichomitus squalens]